MTRNVKFVSLALIVCLTAALCAATASAADRPTLPPIVINKDNGAPLPELSPRPEASSRPERPAGPDMTLRPNAGEIPQPLVTMKPLTSENICNWELAVKDSVEYRYYYGIGGGLDYIKKIAILDITAQKKGGTDFYGKYTGTGTIQIFNALCPNDDASPVLYGGQCMVSKSFKLTFTIEPLGDTQLTVAGYSQIPDRAYDGIAKLEYKVVPSKLNGIYQYTFSDELTIKLSSAEFEQGDETAMLYVDGGYLALALDEHWQIPEPFIGMVYGIPTGKTVKK